jgi:hypothetical protein
MNQGLLRGIVLAAWALGLCGHAVRAQERVLGPVDQDVLSLLLELPDPVAAVRYTPGSLDRAARFQERLRRLQEDMLAWGDTVIPQVVLVLSPEEWSKVVDQRPYGFPVRLDDRTSALPAWGNPESVELWRELVAGPLPSIAEFSARGTAEEVSAMALADTFLLLDLCRDFTRRIFLAGGADRVWLSDVLGHLVLMTSDRRAKFPSGLDAGIALRGVHRALPGSAAAYGHGLGGVDWMAYQSHFARGAEAIWADRGKGALRQLLKIRRRKGRALEVRDLQGPFPTLAEWHRRWN